MAEDVKATALDESEPNSVIDGPSIVLLDIGGMRFKTTETTINKSGFFRALLSGKFGDNKQNDGSYFVDRNGEYFKYLLDFLRYGYVTIPSKYATMIHLEAEFYQINLDLSDIVEKLKLPSLLLVSMQTCRTIYINGKKLEKEYKKYKLDEHSWQNINYKSYSTFLAHLISQCGYEIVKTLESTKESCQIYLKPAVQEFIFLYG